MLAVGFIGNSLGDLRIGFRERTGHPSILHDNEILQGDGESGQLRYLNAVSISLSLPISRAGLLARVAWVNGAVEKLAKPGISALPAFTWGTTKNNCSLRTDAISAETMTHLLTAALGCKWQLLSSYFRLRLRQLGQPLVERLLRKAAFHPGCRGALQAVNPGLVLAIALAIAARGEQSCQQY
jgi:hypothetical protein